MSTIKKRLLSLAVLLALTPAMFVGVVVGLVAMAFLKGFMGATESFKWMLDIWDPDRNDPPYRDGA